MTAMVFLLPFRRILTSSFYVLSLLVCLIRWRPSPQCRRTRQTNRSFNTMRRARSSLETTMILKVKRLVTSSRSPTATTIRQRERVIVVVPVLYSALGSRSPFFLTALEVSPSSASPSRQKKYIFHFLGRFRMCHDCFLFLSRSKYQLPSIPPINHFPSCCSRAIAPSRNTPHSF